MGEFVSEWVIDCYQTNKKFSRGRNNISLFAINTCSLRSTVSKWCSELLQNLARNQCSIRNANHQEERLSLSLSFFKDGG